MLGVPVRTWAMALQGLGGQPIEVQAVVLSGLPRVIVVGLPDVAIGEATDRIRAAFGALGKTLPPHRITLNLSPVDLPKHGAGFDLAMAVALLAVSGVIDSQVAERAVHIGELGLDGAVLPVRGVLPAVVAAREAGFSTVVVPRACATEAELVTGIRVVAVGSPDTTELTSRCRHPSDMNSPRSCRQAPLVVRKIWPMCWAWMTRCARY